MTLPSNTTGPGHYRRGKIQVWDFIRDQGLSYHLGNVIKYVCRAGFKSDRLEDLKKATHYLQNEIEHQRQELNLPLTDDKPVFFRFSDLAKEFRRAFGVKSDLARGAGLIDEEFRELVKETPCTPGDLKELADLVYVCYQYAEDCGYDLDEALIRVHASNMTKLASDGSVFRNEEGKVLKGPNYEPPHLDDLISNDI